MHTLRTFVGRAALQLSVVNMTTKTVRAFKVSVSSAEGNLYGGYGVIGSRAGL
jgi:hypothetical protein